MDYNTNVKRIVDDLNKNYEPSVGTMREGGEYFEKPLIKIKADGTTTSPKDLLEYLKFKNKNVKDKLLKQIMLDWINGDIKNGYELTKLGV